VTLRLERRGDRERILAAMARDAAHELATPLASMRGWLELLRDRGDPVIAEALPHIEGDIERLERVALRIERIGQPPRRDPVEPVAVARQVVAYFAARMPTLAHPIDLRIEGGGDGCTVPGDAVLLEWALESVVNNAIDALAGRGGAIVVGVDAPSADAVRVRVADDGPGVPRALREKVFSPGFSTKESASGMGLALSRRIVESGHGGRLRLAPSDTGAVFEMLLPR
jgi:signal transduction histidine kinase